MLNTNKCGAEEWSSESRGRITVKLCNVFIGGNGHVSISGSQNNSLTSGADELYEASALQITSSSFGGSTTYADTDVEEYMSSAKVFHPIDSMPGFYYINLPVSISDSSAVLAYVRDVFEKQRSFEVTIISESSPPDR